MNWKDITFGQYIELQSIWDAAENDLLDKSIAALSVIYKEDASKWSLSKFNLKIKEMEFVNTQIRTTKPKSKYGQYRVDLDLSEINMGQWIDFENFRKNDDKTGILSVFMRPDGKDYLDGYDVNKVRQYIENEMSAVDVMSLYAFFLRFQENYMIISQLYLQQRTKKTTRKLKRAAIFMRIYSCYWLLRGKLTSIIMKFKK